MKKELKKLIEYSFTSASNKKKEMVIGKVQTLQAKKIEEYIGVNIKGCERVIDNYMIRHAIGEHGNIEYEKKRGQIAITLDDFLLIPEIFTNPDTIEYIGKNSLKQDLIRYTKKIGYLYVVVEAVRVAKRGNKLVFTTLFKKKNASTRANNATEVPFLTSETFPNV
ncbi:MAG TPA: hypothetical protein VNW06_03535 [Cytophagaceae bacterium]|nr:hypothetical protein [Cytophagaceae bacterium]